ncbi:hypothetical protein LTR17_022221 [Elasticomyces elasticus]|nr:hypothetical protein LTR17_022221 [Elasticomyces elasticus]
MDKATASLKQIYTEYKPLTNYVLSWINANHTAEADRQQTTRFKSTRDALEAARKVNEQKLQVPHSVISALLLSIKRRRQVHDIYCTLNPLRNDVRADQNHLAFIERLEAILALLLPLRTRSRTTTTKSVPIFPSPVLGSATNRFGALDIEDATVAEAESTSDSDNPALEPKVLSADAHSQQDVETFFLEDDDLGEWIELSYFLRVKFSLLRSNQIGTDSRQEIDAICTEVCAYWRQAAKENIPVLLAAWLTTTALHAMGRCFTRVEHIAPSFEILIEKWVKHRVKGVSIRFKDVPTLSQDVNGRFTEGLALYHAGQVLEHCRSWEDYRIIHSNAGRHHDPLTVFRLFNPPPTEELDPFFYEDDLALDKMQESMRDLNTSKRAMAALELSEKDCHISEPLLPLLKQATTNTDKPLPFCLVVGMDMLVSTYRCFIWPDDVVNKGNCRIEALKFARDVKSSYEAVVHAIDEVCDQNETNLQYQKRFIISRIEQLNQFTAEKRFDLYYQAPWTAGSHMVEILLTASWEGLDLCTSTGYLCAVLHLYNALRHLDPTMKEIPLCEQLCEVFRSLLFLGPLPKQRFSSHFRRAMGSGVDKSASTRTSASNRRHTLQPSRAVNARKCSPAEVSLFYELHNNNFQTTIDFWVRVHEGQSISGPSEKQKQQVSEQVHSVPFSDCLNRIYTAVLPEFTGDSPVMRMNFLSVFQICISTLRDIVDAIMNDPDNGIDGLQRSNRIEVVDLLLVQIDEHLEDDSKRPLLKFWRPLNLAKDVFRSIKIPEYTWDI